MILRQLSSVSKKDIVIICVKKKNKKNREDTVDALEWDSRSDLEKKGIQHFHTNVRTWKYFY